LCKAATRAMLITRLPFAVASRLIPADRSE
jgi:hypothetical protein